MTEEQKIHIIHALGLTRRGGRGKFGRRWAYRNYFAAGEADLALWRDLVSKGFAREFSKPDSRRPFQSFEVTEKGMSAAGVLAYVPASIRNRRVR